MLQGYEKVMGEIDLSYLEGRRGINKGGIILLIRFFNISLGIKKGTFQLPPIGCWLRDMGSAWYNCDVEVDPLVKHGPAKKLQGQHVTSAWNLRNCFSFCKQTRLLVCLT